MKKVLFASIIGMMLIVLQSSTAFAQKFFVYDGDDFNVMLTCTNDNSRVTKVSFSANGEWNQFEIEDYTDLENATEGGFMYTVRDGVGNRYTIDYYRSSDNIIVRGLTGGGEWTLYRRQ
ncbi:MAG: hypothetical protein EAZ57_04105 [Cytophagales bacterium]|nr:MAG: hypothetical protein EAZ67_05120 [Cytophagales bacterium]TAF61388.1 MAG: hypothetical protein EAZ57_04105 [Cytophagales bacterium]